MDFIGFDLGEVSSQVCVTTDDGGLIECRIKTDREHISELLEALIGSPFRRRAKIFFSPVVIRPAAYPLHKYGS